MKKTGENPEKCRDGSSKDILGGTCEATLERIPEWFNREFSRRIREAITEQAVEFPNVNGIPKNTR